MDQYLSIASDVKLGKDVKFHKFVNLYGCVIGDHTHIASGARLAGNVVVGSGVHVGLGAVVREGIRIGDHAVVGAGAVVIDDVLAHAVVVGVPARELKRVIS